MKSQRHWHNPYLFFQHLALILLACFVGEIVSQNGKEITADSARYFSGLSPNRQFRFIEQLKTTFKFLTPQNLLAAVQDDATFSSSECKTHLDDFVNKLTTQDFEEGLWPLLMADSWGKIQEGILRGHWNSLGDFDECIRIRANYANDDNNKLTHFKGRQCNVHISLPFEDQNMSVADSHRIGTKKVKFEKPDMSVDEAIGLRFASFTLGTCFPSSCSRQDVQTLFNSTTMELLGLPSAVWACYDDDKPPIDGAVVAVIVVISVIIILAIAATLLDANLRQRAKNRPDSNYPESQGAEVRALLAFSLYTNTEKWLNTKTGVDNLGCIHGLRFLSMCWVVLGHTWNMLLTSYNWNLLDILKINQSWTMLVIINGTFSVDTFFTMGGVLLSYQLLKTLEKTGGKFNPLMLYLHRYLRLTPTYAILLGIVATLQPYLSTGPSWAVIDIQSQYCRKNWWTNLLYINNLVTYKLGEDTLDGQCFGEAWYLANDMQFFIVAPFFIFLLWKWERIGAVVLGLATIASVAVPGILTDVNELPPTAVPLKAGKSYEYQTDIYIKPWTRCGPYIVGVWVGYILYKMAKKRSKIPPIFVAIGWMLCTGTALALLFGPINIFDPNYVTGRWEGVLYAAFHRFCWALVIGWIILACVTGRGGIVNSILSMKTFIPVGRLSFCVYLAHAELQLIFTTRARQPFVYDAYTTTNLFFSHLLIALLVGYFLTMLFESPFIQLEKIIFGRRENRSKVEEFDKLPHITELQLPRAHTSAAAFPLYSGPVNKSSLA